MESDKNLACNFCYDQVDQQFEEETGIQEFDRNLKKIGLSKFNMFRPIDIVKLKVDLFKAMIYPEKYRNLRFPAPFFLSTYSFQQKTSFNLNTNASGCTWAQINMGQFLDSTTFFTGLVGSQDGTHTVPQSNIFTWNTAGAGAANLDGVTTLSFATAAVGTAQITGNNSLILNALTAGPVFNAVRAGPMSVRYEYIGRLDATQGNVAMGLNYTNVSINGTTTGANPIPQTGVIGIPASALGSFKSGLLPDIGYSTLSSIEDCPFARVESVTTSLKAIFVPQDYAILNLRPPTDAASVPVPQRLFIIIVNGPVSATGVARITVTANWEGVPSRQSADWVTTDYSIYPPNFDAKEVFSYMIQNNLIITKDDDEFGMSKFVAAIQAAL